MSKWHPADIPGLVWSISFGPDELPEHLMERVRAGEFTYESVADADDGRIIFSQLVRRDGQPPMFVRFPESDHDS